MEEVSLQMAKKADGRRRSALVTGGGTGIGYAIAAALLDRGFAVTISGRRQEVLTEAAERLAKDGGHKPGLVRTCAVDVGDPVADAEAVNSHLAAWDGLDAVVVSSGVYIPADFLDISPEQWRHVQNVNVDGAFFVSQAAARAMASRGGGRIILIGSITGLQAEPASAPYSTSKSALEGLARAIAVDAGRRGVTANVVAPGWTRTPMATEDIQKVGEEGMLRINPLARAAEPEEIANLVVYLAADAPTFLTGTTIRIDGGQSAVAAAV